MKWCTCIQCVSSSPYFPSSHLSQLSFFFHFQYLFKNPFSIFTSLQVRTRCTYKLRACPAATTSFNTQWKKQRSPSLSGFVGKTETENQAGWMIQGPRGWSERRKPLKREHRILGPSLGGTHQRRRFSLTVFPDF